jgi:hypothetical protein
MRFLFASILLSVGLTVLLNWGLRRVISRPRRNDVNETSPVASFGGPDALSGRDEASAYSYDEATVPPTMATQGWDSDVPDRPDLRRR